MMFGYKSYDFKCYYFYFFATLLNDVNFILIKLQLVIVVILLQQIILYRIS